MKKPKLIKSIKLILIGFIFINISSCGSKSKSSFNILEKFGIVSEFDTLFITAEFDECGEWGGHVEKLILTSTQGNLVEARLIVDSISCKEIITFEDKENGYLYSDLDDEKRVILVDSIKQLKKEEEKLIANFIHRIVDLSLNPYYSRNCNSGSPIPMTEFSGVAQSIDIRNSNLTLRLQFYNLDNSYNPGFARTRHQIFSRTNDIN